jgi:hypothetical protein
MADETIPEAAYEAAGEVLEEDFHYRQDSLDAGRDALRAGAPILLRALADELDGIARVEFGEAKALASYAPDDRASRRIGYADGHQAVAARLRERADAIESEGQ